MAEVNISHINKTFGNVPVIPDLSLNIPHGSFTVLVGPSGCGKSTLLRMIAGLESPTAGRISIGGKDVTNAHPSDRGIAMVFQSYALYPHMSVYDNVSFSLKLAKMPKPEIEERVKRAAGILQLDQYLDRKPGQLSGGQRQRVAIGRAIVRDPKVFLFDEPLSNLDAALRNQMRVELMDLHKKLGATMIYVTHDQIEAMTMADQIVVLNKGHIEQVGAPLDLYDQPATPFVAGFIGSPKMNILTGGAAERFGGELAGIRPEDVTLSRDGGDWKGRIRLIEQLGSDTIAHVELDDVGEFIVRTGREVAALQGQEIYASANRQKFHVFRNGCRVEPAAA
ncbi:ATP-binding cassette domain-containing protein [Brucella sp. BE17]|uniref:ABC transporter ATP-binding protein n=1 Tax=Brucella sp. BE17 TaxID=3142977 RepID=UPI0031BB91C9